MFLEIQDIFVSQCVKSCYTEKDMGFCGSGFCFYPVVFFCLFFSFWFLFVCFCENVANITRVYYSVVKNVFSGNLGIL